MAEPGFTNNQWMDGQLIIIGEEYFSFAWVPIENQIFFGRPSAELALKMLQESGATTVARGRTWDAPPSMDADVNTLKEYVSSCLEGYIEAVASIGEQPSSSETTADCNFIILRL